MKITAVFTAGVGLGYLSAWVFICFVFLQSKKTIRVKVMETAH